MKTDIVFPQRNEAEFAAMAKRLGYGQLLFVYDTLQEAINEGTSMQGVNWQLPVQKGVLFTTQNKATLFQKIQQATQRKLFTLVQARDEAYNRFALEKTGADMLFGFEYVAKTDHLHYRRSGLDQVLCRSARENEKAVGIAFSSFLHTENKAQALGRIMQNVRFCRKYGVELLLGSFASEPLEMRGWHELEGFGKVIS